MTVTKELRVEIEEANPDRLDILLAIKAELESKLWDVNREIEKLEDE